MTETAPDIAREARDLIRQSVTAALASALEAGRTAWPYASFVTVACDHDAAPILLLSDLAEHTKNLKRDPRVSLLFTGPGGAADPLAQGRVTVLGSATATDEPRHKARFLARHPEAEGYAGFRDFRFYRVEAIRAHLVAGFGRIHWVEPVRCGGDWASLAGAEAGIVAHMNADHGEAIRLYAEKLLGLPALPKDEAWRMTGIDPEGCDLRGGEQWARLGFEAPISSPDEARAEFVRLAKRARAA